MSLSMFHVCCCCWIACMARNMARSRMLKSGDLGGWPQRVIFQPPFSFLKFIIAVLDVGCSIVLLDLDISWAPIWPLSSNGHYIFKNPPVRLFFVDSDCFCFNCACWMMNGTVLFCFKLNKRMKMDFTIPPFTSYRILMRMCKSCTKHYFGNVALMFAPMLYIFVWEQIAVPVCHHQIKPVLINVDFIHHVAEWTIWFKDWFCILLPFLNSCRSEMGLHSTLCTSDEAFLEVMVQCAAWDACSIEQALKSLPFVEGHIFDSSLQVIRRVLYFPTRSWLSCELGSFSSNDGLPVLLHNLQMVALLTLNFSLICPINLWLSLPSAECPLVSNTRTSAFLFFHVLGVDKPWVEFGAIAMGFLIEFLAQWQRLWVFNDVAWN